MAYKDSDELKTDERYPLGDYSFRIERSSVPGSTNDKIEAICTDKDGKNARKSIQVPSSAKIDGWYVDANETEATVYVVYDNSRSRYTTGDLNTTSLASGVSLETGEADHVTFGVTPYVTGEATINGGSFIFASKESPVTGSPICYFWYNISGGGGGGTHVYPSEITLNGKTAYFCRFDGTGGRWNYGVIPLSDVVPNNYGYVAWDMLYGEEEAKNETKIVGRFAIELKDAGGVGPGSNWTDPGDYDPDWEPDDPTHTLYVTVTGALSGRHNDPIEDPSYSYIPADKDTVKDYGCGGDGGHGGGGGAGASTVVIHKFATNQANYKEVTAIARRHGYGSGGGKGGKGGDGCILVYY